ncbi:MAG: TlyA family RNA methyltransferase [Firmicutes bacterium]|nr:TlyA family RNA methyltransferase [Bacillota bacterium]
MRLDLYLVEQQMVKSRSQATDLIKRGLVSVDDIIQTKPGYSVDQETIKILEQPSFVSRAGEKLLQAIFDYELDFNGKTIIDIGSSTGGFTDCALQHGASLVYAYDVGKKQMVEPLKSDARVHLFEETNILDVSIPNADIIVIDVSFTSIKPILKHLEGFKGEIVALIKPQFEAGNIHFKQGVLKDMKIHKKILIEVLIEARSLGFSIQGIKKSGLKGKAGNQEYVLYINKNEKLVDVREIVEDALC